MASAPQRSRAKERPARSARRKVAHLAESAGQHAACRSAAHHDEVVFPVGQRSRQRPAARVLDVALRPDEHLQQAHEQHVRGPAARAGQRRTRLGHRAVARAAHPESVCGPVGRPADGHGTRV